MAFVLRLINDTVPNNIDNSLPSDSTKQDTINKLISGHVCHIFKCS